jgi:DNA-binding NarL/FixJ family response regulator
MSRPCTTWLREGPRPGAFGPAESPPVHARWPAPFTPPSERDALGELTLQQRQIVRLPSDGLANREIGDRLFLSPRTVSSHLYRSCPKLGVARRHQLQDVAARASPSAPAHDSG